VFAVYPGVGVLFVVSKNTIFISTLFREEPFLFLTHRVLPLVGLAILIVTVMSFNWHYSTLASGRGLFLFHESLRLGIVKNELNMSRESFFVILFHLLFIIEC